MCYLFLNNIIFWSDSTDVLGWVRGYSKVFKPFVANRIGLIIGEIQLHSNQDQWRYVPTKMHPADHLTRELKVIELIEKTCWWKVPEFVENSESKWPADKVCQVASEQNTREVKQKYKYIEGVYVNLI